MASQSAPEERKNLTVEDLHPIEPASAGDRSDGQLSQGSVRRGGGASFSLVVLRRIGFSVVVLLAIVYFTFFGLEMARGSTATDALRHGFTAGVGYLSQPCGC